MSKKIDMKALTEKLDKVTVPDHLINATAVRMNRAAENKASRKFPKLCSGVIFSAAMVSMLGIGVWAYNEGWLETLFSENTEYIETYIDDYTIDAKLTEESSHDDIPYDFELNHIVSDGDVILINYTLTDKENDQKYPSADKLRLNVSLTGHNAPPTVSGPFSSACETTYLELADGTKYLRLNSDESIMDGCRVTLHFCPKDMPYHLIDTAEETRCGDVYYNAVMDIESIPDKTVTLIPEDGHAFLSTIRGGMYMEKNIIVESVKASALNVSVKFKAPDNANNFIVSNCVTLHTKSGESYQAEPYFTSYSTDPYKPKDSDGYWSQEINVDTEKFIPIDELEAVSIGDLTIALE